MGFGDFSLYRLAAARRSGSKRRQARFGRSAADGTSARGFEALESRALLTTFYIDNNLLLTADRDHSGGLSAGDQVTFGNGQSYQQADLTYDAAPTGGDVGTAFSSISQALASPLVQAGDTIDIAGGTYTDAVTIDKSITLQGDGSVVLEGSQPGGAVATITITGNPEAVTLDNLDFTSPSYNAGLLDNGGGTLNLTDVSGRDAFNIDGVTNLNIVRTTSAPQHVSIGQDILVFADGGIVGAPQTPPTEPSPNTGFVEFQDATEITFQVTNLSVTTGSGSDSFSVGAIPDTTITVDGGDPTPQALPGDSLILPDGNPNDLSVTSDASGYSGTWNDGTNPPIHFSHFESVGPGPFVEKAQGFSATEGVAYSGTILQFDDSTPNVPLADYTVAIDWGDGQTSAGSVVAGGPYGNLAVAGTHTYAKEGSYTVSVAISRPGTINTALTASGFANASPLVGTGVTLSPTEGQAIGNPNAVVATFAHENGGDINDGFTATIDWGDGNSSTGTISTVAGNPAEWAVSGSHVYAEDGSHPISVLVDGAMIFPMVSIGSRAIVAELPFTLTPDTLTGTAGVALGSSGPITVAGFGQASLQEQNATFQATIDWGDGVTSSGTVNSITDPMTDSIAWIVDGSHTYRNAGTYSIHVVLTQDGNAEASVTSTAIIAAAPQPTIVGSPETLTGSEGVAIGASPGQMVASFVEQQIDNSNFQATIDWGDGTTSSGTVSSAIDVFPPSVSRTYWQVHGTHAYAEAGTYSIDVELTEGGNIVSTVTSTAIISGPPLTPNQRFVSNVYSDLLDRAVDQSGMTFWAGRLDGGLSRELLVLDIAATREYLQDEVTSLYEHYLHRAAEPAALAADSQLLAEGITDEQLAGSIVGSDEYFALQGGTNDGFLTALFQDALNRSIETGALGWFDQYLAAGGTRADVAAIIFASHEYHADVVSAIYQQMLDRSPNTADQAYWADQLDGGATDEQLIAVIAASDEYFGKQ